LFGEKVTMAEGLFITVLGMGVTFFILIVLSYLLDLLRIIFYKDPNKEKAKAVESAPKAEETPVTVEDGDDLTEELVAVIAAAVAASLSTTTHNIVVRNIRRIQDDSPVWNKAGRFEQIRQML